MKNSPRAIKVLTKGRVGGLITKFVTIPRYTLSTQIINFLILEINATDFILSYFNGTLIQLPLIYSKIKLLVQNTLTSFSQPICDGLNEKYTFRLIYE